MTLNFPNSPTIGDQFTGSNNYIYEYDGEKWNFVKLVGGDFSTSAIQDGAVTTAKLADDAVTTAKIADANVTTDKIADANVTTAKIADNAVTADKIGTKTFVSYASICDQKAYNIDGGTFTNNAWRTRDLNTELYDPDNIVTVSANQFTLTAGTYLIKWSAPAYDVNRHLAVLQDTTASQPVATGTAAFSNTTSPSVTYSFGSFRAVLTGTTVYEIQHWCNTTKASTGFGIAHDINGYDTIYTTVEIYKEA